MDKKHKRKFWPPSSTTRFSLSVIAKALLAIGGFMGAVTKRTAVGVEAPAKALADRPLLRMHPHYGKLVDVMLCLLHEAERLDMVVTTYELVKAVFLADRAHLNKYCRPITFDRYLAMKHGPVGHSFYNMLKEDAQILRMTGPVRWRRRASATPPRRRYWAETGPTYEYFGPERAVDLEDALSPSDVEELHNALREVKRLGVSGVWRKTHRDAAWRGAFVPDGGQKSYPMDPLLLFDNPSAEDIEDFAIHCEGPR